MTVILNISNGIVNVQISNGIVNLAQWSLTNKPCWPFATLLSNISHFFFFQHCFFPCQLTQHTSGCVFWTSLFPPIKHEHQPPPLSKREPFPSSSLWHLLLICPSHDLTLPELSSIPVADHLLLFPNESILLVSYVPIRPSHDLSLLSSWLLRAPATCIHFPSFQPFNHFQLLPLSLPSHLNSFHPPAPDSPIYIFLLTLVYYTSGIVCNVNPSFHELFFITFTFFSKGLCSRTLFELVLLKTPVALGTTCPASNLASAFV